MASSRTETQVTWSAASSVTVSSATVVWSDAMLFNIEDWDGELQVHIDNAGTPASGDTCAVYVAYTTGDILGDSGNDFASTEHAEWAMTLDTYSANTPGEDPADKTAQLRTGPIGFKIGVSCPQAASRNIAVRARFVTHRPQ